MKVRMTAFLAEQLARVVPFVHADGWKLQRLVEDTPSRNCRGVPSEVFFPPADEWDREPAKLKERERIGHECHACPVADECLAGALLRGERFGGWGGVAQPDFQELLRLFRREHPEVTEPVAVDRAGCHAKRHGNNSAYADGCRCPDARADRRESQRKNAATRKGVA